MRNAPATSRDLLLFDKLNVFKTCCFKHQSRHGFIQYMDLKYICVLPRGLCRLSQATRHSPFSWQTKTALVNLIFQWGRTVWMFSVFLLVPRLSVNSRIPGTLRAGVSLRFTPSRGIRIPTFPTLWKNISPKNFRKSLFWLWRQSGPIRKWAAGAWGSLSDSICRQDRKSSLAMVGFSALSPFPSGRPPPPDGTLRLQDVSSHLP